MKNVGLFGGTFDPIHNGHIELARYALNNCNLSEIIFIPTAVPPHKTNIKITSFKHRVAMLKLAIGVEQQFSISTIEEKLNQPSFSIDTICKIIENNEEQNEYYFLIGVDAFLEINTWKDSARVLNIINFIVSARQGYVPELYRKFMEDLHFTRKESFWYNSKSGRKNYYLDIDIPGISSSNLRESIQKRKISGDMINKEVFQYINRHQLYRK